jgi:hypothetical protein
LAHQESRDGADVTGEYSYVDANGALVTVTYTAGVNGYQEERVLTENFVQIRARPVTAPRPVAVAAPVRAPRPVAPRPVAPVAPARNDDSDLVARIIAQLTPFIRDTVSSSLSGGRTASRPVTAPAPRPVPVQVASSAASGSRSVGGVFGANGENNVRVETPNFNFAYDL